MVRFDPDPNNGSFFWDKIKALCLAYSSILSDAYSCKKVSSVVTLSQVVSPGCCWVSYPVPERDLGVGGLDDSPHAPEEVGREHEGLDFVEEDFSLLLAREMAGASPLRLVGHRSRRVCSRAQLLEARRGLGRERGERAGAGRGGRRLLQPQVRAEEV